LWHDDDSLDDLLEDLGHFDDLLDSGVDGDFLLLEPVDDLDFSLDVVDGVGVLLELVDSDDFLLDGGDFLDFGVLLGDLDDLLDFDWDFLDDLLHYWH